MTIAEPLVSSLTVGIDISKASLDVHCAPANTNHRFPNTPEGHQALIEALGNRTVRACVFEATGHYGRDLHKALYAAGLPTIQVNPRQASFFLKSHTPSHKTDRSDAAALAAMARALPLRVVPPPSPGQEALRELVSVRNALVRERTALRARIQTVLTATVREALNALLTVLEEQLDVLEQDTEGVIAQNPVLKAKYDLARTLPGIGKHSARALLAFLPELGTLTGKQIAALVGVAPKTRDSGTFKGRRSIHGGRTELRTVLYMAALSAMRTNPVIKKWIEHNQKSSKPHKVVRIAVVRKLLVTLNAMAKNNTPWKENYLD